MPAPTHPARLRRAAVTGIAVLIGMSVWVTPAAARALLIAGGAAELPVAELSTDSVVTRIEMPGPVSAVAASPFGGKAYAASQNALIEIDVDTRTEIRRAVLPGAPVSQLVSLRDGRLLALQNDQVTIVDPASLTVAGTIALGAPGVQLTAGRGASRATAVLSGGRVAILALDEARVLRTARVAGAVGAAIDGGGRTWVVAGRALRLIPAGRSKVSKRGRIVLPAGVGGAVALSPRDARLAVGAGPGATTGAIVNLTTRRVRRLSGGAGPGAPAWNLDATRVYMADAAGASVSIIGASSGRRLDVIALPGSTPSSVVEQPGLALLPGSDDADTLIGTAGADRMEGMAGDDYLRGGRGRDVINGDTGDDRLSGGAFSDVLDGGEGNDYLTAAPVTTRSRPPSAMTAPMAGPATTRSTAATATTYSTAAMATTRSSAGPVTTGSSRRALATTSASAAAPAMTSSRVAAAQIGSSRATTVTTSSSAAAARRRSAAAAATTSPTVAAPPTTCAATRATTSSRATRVTTSSEAATATTSSTAAPARIASMADRGPT